MRLLSIKLAGFKSFVDPVVIPVAGQMVGVVGPNGCGKSNVIDAVRWVLGESHARQLRGSSMMDVIFNGSSTRKAISRASVELVFDNSDGRTFGTWSQYAEIAVKRVLTRNGESTYHINQSLVRRRDVMDVFLGTGLSSKTPYAIIEQGMIARIIEARPEELRAYLEEAAGISRYKERRRETETRLGQAQQNLLRLDDIQCELQEKMTHLSVQAEQAAHWQSLQDALLSSQQRLWRLKWRDAQLKSTRYELQMSQLSLQVIAQEDDLCTAGIAALNARIAHDAVSEALHQAQAQVFSAGAEVSRLEQNVQHARDTQERISQQLQHIQTQQQGIQQQQQLGLLNLSATRQRVKQLGKQELAHQQSLIALTQQLTRSDAEMRIARQSLSEQQRQLTQAEQQLAIMQTQLAGTEKSNQQLMAQRQRFQQERDHLPLLNEQVYLMVQASVAALSTTCQRLSEEEQQFVNVINQYTQDRQPIQLCWEQTKQQCARDEGQLSGLRILSQQMSSHPASDVWWAQQGLADTSQLWQLFHVADGWEKAVEIALGHWLFAVVLPSNVLVVCQSDTPNGLVCVWNDDANDGADNSLLPMLNLLSCHAEAKHALQGLLQEVYVLDDITQLHVTRMQLSPSAKCYTRQGHELTRYGWASAPIERQEYGMLFRQKQIQQLETSVNLALVQQTALSQQLSQLDLDIANAQQSLSHTRSQLQAARQQLHVAQLDVQQQQQQRTHIISRHQQLDHDLAHLDTQSLVIQAEHEQLEQTNQQQYSQCVQWRTQMQSARNTLRGMDEDVEQQRETYRQLEREGQELHYTLRLEQSGVITLQQSIQQQEDILNGLNAQQLQLQQELANVEMNVPQQQRSEAMAVHHAAEQQLSHCREELDQARQQLRTYEEQCLTLQHSLTPLNKQLDRTRLAQQEAYLMAEQCREQLQALHVDEALWNEPLPNIKLETLHQEIARFNVEIAELGAVNLLALEEMKRAEERAQYLQAQHLDLNTAIATLQQAMYSMDQETRILFKVTFDAVNASLAEFFGTLFGGGHAELSMMASELLDAGIQITAQPPGKKNSSIQLLSGGEKTLTALALVFALFQLNPAPFCLLDEVDAPLDDSNTERYVRLVKQMSSKTQFLFVTHNRITMEAAGQLIGVTMQEAGVSRIVTVDLEQFHSQ